MEIFKVCNGINGLEKNYYNKQVLEIVDRFYPMPLHYGLGKVKSNFKYKIGGDYSKSYTLGIYKYFKNAKIPGFSICDNWITKEMIIYFNNLLSLKNGWYLVKGFNLDGVYVDTCLMPLFMVKEF